MQRGEQQHDDAPALHCLDGASEEVGSQGLEVLQHAHAERVPQDLVRVRVEAVADGGGGHEEGEGVVLLRIQQATLHHLLHLVHPLFAVTAVGWGASLSEAQRSVEGGRRGCAITC